ncbi:MAG: putative toxin-antitoxin system toxin component, PIN family [Chloroflexota bacterium]
MTQTSSCRPLISQAGAPARLLLALRAGAFELVASPALLAELREVLARPRIRRYVTADEAAAYVLAIERDAIVVDDPPPDDDTVAPDPDDAYLVALARSARVDALVSGDARVLELRGRLPVTSPAEFLASLPE